jgi:hypothetical protein
MSYLDDGLAPTSLMSHLAHRQQTHTQRSYDDAEQWHTDSSTASESEFGSDDQLALQREWEQQVDQFKLLFQIVVCPFVGKFFGRKFGYFCRSPPFPPTAQRNATLTACMRA